MPEPPRCLRGRDVRVCVRARLTCSANRHRAGGIGSDTRPGDKASGTRAGDKGSAPARAWVRAWSRVRPRVVGRAVSDSRTVPHPTPATGPTRTRWGCCASWSGTGRFAASRAERESEPPRSSRRARPRSWLRGQIRAATYGYASGSPPAARPVHAWVRQARHRRWSSRNVPARGAIEVSARSRVAVMERGPAVRIRLSARPAVRRPPGQGVRRHVRAQRVAHDGEASASETDRVRSAERTADRPAPRTLISNRRGASVVRADCTGVRIGYPGSTLVVDLHLGAVPHQLEAGEPIGVE